MPAILKVCLVNFQEKGDQRWHQRRESLRHPWHPSPTPVFSPPPLDCALGVKFSHRLVQCCGGPGHGHGPEFMHTGMTGQEVATPWHPGLTSLLMDHQTDSSYIPCCTHERQT